MKKENQRSVPEGAKAKGEISHPVFSHMSSARSFSFNSTP